MPQNKITDSLEIDLESLEGIEKLTEKQFKFVLGIIDPNLTDIQAYENAYPTTVMSRSNKAIEAVRLKNNPKIAPILKTLKMQGLGQALEDKATHIERLRELSQQAQAAGNYGAAVNAEVNAGKVSGHYVDKYENVNETRKQELKDRMMALTKEQEQEVVH